MRKVDDGGKDILLRGAICCSGGLYDEENNDGFSGD